jgi:hypothetical protein
MVNHKLFVKGERVYSLLISHSHPNILIPVKGIVKDVKYDEVNPEYLIKIIKFYDSADFLRLNFSKMSYVQTFGNKPRRLKFNEDNPLKTHDDFFIDINGPKERKFMVVVDSIMTLQYKQDMFELFNKVEDHIIEKELRNIKQHTCRTAYKGKYNISTQIEFFLRLRRFIGDKITDDDKRWLEFTERL